MELNIQQIMEILLTAPPSCWWTGSPIVSPV